MVCRLATAVLVVGGALAGSAVDGLVGAAAGLGAGNGVAALLWWDSVRREVRERSTRLDVRMAG